MRGSRSVLRQYQYSRFGSIDGMDDLIGIESSRCHISGRNPALDPIAFQGSDDGIGSGFVLRCVAYEYVGHTTALVLICTAFGHVRCPDHLCGIVADAREVGNQTGFAARPAAS